MSWKLKLSLSWMKWCMTQSSWPRRGKLQQISLGNVTFAATFHCQPKFLIYTCNILSITQSLTCFFTVCQDSNSGRSWWQSDKPWRCDTTGEWSENYLNHWTMKANMEREAVSQILQLSNINWALQPPQTCASQKRDSLLGYETLIVGWPKSIKIRNYLNLQISYIIVKFSEL